MSRPLPTVKLVIVDVEDRMVGSMPQKWYWFSCRPLELVRLVVHEEGEGDWDIEGA